MNSKSSSPLGLLQPGRPIEGISAILLPFDASGHISWAEFEQHVGRTLAAGLKPAVNMDTGYVHLLEAGEKQQVLERTASIAGPRGFVAGAYVADKPGATFDQDGYAREIESIGRWGGVPVIFQSFGLTQQSDDGILESYRKLSSHAERFLGFELGSMFAPFGTIYSLDVYRGLLEISQCLGAKHSSLSRQQEWARLQLRNELRPDFHVYTGNDLAIDMVMYGSDYLLGLSSFAPDLFALRDRFWREGDPQFYELNDVLQYLGFFAFRSPVPAYKHSAAMFLALRGWISCDATHPHSPQRPDSDRGVLANILQQLEPWAAQAAPPSIALG